MQEVLRRMGVMHQDVVDGVAVFANRNGFQAEAILHKTLLHVLAEEHLLALTQTDDMVVAFVFVGNVRVDAVVEDDTVLQNLHHRGAFVASGGGHHSLRVGQEDVNAAGKEGAAGAEHELGGDERVFGGAVGRRFGNGAAVGRG